MKITLTDEQKSALLIQHDKTRDGRVRDRIKAVLHSSNGWRSQEIADALLIHETTVRQHLKDYLISNKLKPENSGSQSYLSEQQTHALRCSAIYSAKLANTASTKTIVCHARSCNT